MTANEYLLNALVYFGFAALLGVIWLLNKWTDANKW